MTSFDLTQKSSFTLLQNESVALPSVRLTKRRESAELLYFSSSRLRQPFFLFRNRR